MRTHVYLTIVGMITLAACADGGTDPEPVDADAATLIINPRGLTLPVGGRGQLSAAVRDGSGLEVTSAAIAWSTRDQSIASASSSGEVSGNRVGQTQVIATALGKSDTVNVAVVDNFTLVVSPPVATVNVGGTIQFVVTAFDGSGNPVPAPPVTWASSSTSRATIASNGVARGVTAGTTNITASAGQRTSQPALLTVRDTATSSPCGGIANVAEFVANVDYGFKAVNLVTDGGFTLNADDQGHLTATMTRMQNGPFTAAWWGPISGTASVTQRVNGTGVTTLSGGGPIIALPPAGLPQMSLIVDLATCRYVLRAAAVIRTRLVPEVGGPLEGPEQVAQVQFSGPVGAWGTLGISVDNLGMPAHSLVWAALNPDKNAVMPLGLMGALFEGHANEPFAGQGSGGLTIVRH